MRNIRDYIHNDINVSEGVYRSINPNLSACSDVVNYIKQACDRGARITDVTEIENLFEKIPDKFSVAIRYNFKKYRVRIKAYRYLYGNRYLWLYDDRKHVTKAFDDNKIHKLAEKIFSDMLESPKEISDTINFTEEN